MQSRPLGTRPPWYDGQGPRLARRMGQWARNELWWRELRANPSTVVRLAGMTVTVVVAIGGAIGKWYGLF
jgi:hypothetical protein